MFSDKYLGYYERLRKLCQSVYTGRRVCLLCHSVYSGRGAELMFDDSLDVVDFCPSNNIAVIYITEAELVAGCAYRRRLVRLRRVTVITSSSLG